MKKLKTVILAAGAGTRMKSDKAKVLHEVSGKPMLSHILDSAKEANSDEIAVIVGHKKEDVINILPEGTEYFIQVEQKGTGDALKQAQDFITEDSTILVLNGDAPLVSPETIAKVFQKHNDNNNAVTVLTAELDNPTGYGRIITENGQIERIVEEKDANDLEKQIKEVNSGIYCFEGPIIKETLDEIKQNNAQGEYYLTDAIEIIKDKGYSVGTFKLDDSDEIAAANSKRELAQIEKIFRKRINNRLMDSGVTIIDPDTTYIESTVTIGKDTVIYPGCLLEGKTVIGSDCVIGMNSHITDSAIGDQTKVESSTIEESEIGVNSAIGPYAFLRPNCKIGDRVKIGDFVEVKNSTVGNDTKASHLTYIGDSDIGSNVNLGCGTVFVNYDGKNKFRTRVGDNCFIGCNTNLIAPVIVEDNSYIAAGSTITDNVPEEGFAIARARQVNKENYRFKLPHKE